MKASMISLAVLLAAVAFVVLYVIIGIPLWVAFVAAGGAFVLWTLLAGGMTARGSGHAQH